MEFEGPKPNEPLSAQERTSVERREPATPSVERGIRRESFELNGTRVEFLGVSHDPSVAEQHQKEFEDAIRTASLVILETVPNAEGLFSDKAIDEFRAFLAWGGLNMSREEAVKAIEAGKRGLSFYAENERRREGRGRRE